MLVEGCRLCVPHVRSPCVSMLVLRVFGGVGFGGPRRGRWKSGVAVDGQMSCSESWAAWRGVSGDVCDGPVVSGMRAVSRCSASASCPGCVQMDNKCVYLAAAEVTRNAPPRLWRRARPGPPGQHAPGPARPARVCRTDVEGRWTSVQITHRPRSHCSPRPHAPRPCGPLLIHALLVD